MSGVVTGLVSLFLHLFWKFQTANSKRSKYKFLLPSFSLPSRKRLTYRELKPASKKALISIAQRGANSRSQNRNYYMQKAIKQYSRQAA